MIVAPLKSSLQVSIIIILLLSIGLWCSTFLFVNTNPFIINYKEHILYSYFFLNGFSPNVNQLINLGVILLGAFLVNFLAIEQEITAKTNYLPAFFYVLFAFSASTSAIVEPLLTANLFILPALFYLINSYKKSEALTEFFKAGLFMGLASFFCIHFIVVFPLSLIALFILRPFNWREWSILLFGLCAPLYIFMCISYITTNEAFTVFNMMQEATSSLQMPIISEYYVCFIGVIILGFFLALLKYIGKGFGGKVKTQKTKYILLWMFLLCLLMVFFEQMSDMILLPCIIPLCIILSDYIFDIKQLKIANTLLLLFLGSFSIIYLHALGLI